MALARGRENGKTVTARVTKSAKRSPDIPWEICFREIAAEIGQMWRHFHERGKKRREKNATDDTARARACAINANRE